MTYTTTSPSEPGLYHIQLFNSYRTAGRLFPDGKWNILNFGSGLRAREVVAQGGKFGPRIEPPRDDDDELATVEWLREMGIPGSPQPGLSFLELSCVIHLEYTDNTGTTVTLCWETPTKSKARQIMEALR